ncbi:MAG: TolC family protein [Chloracidobacterium sp.]|nr:TolC family protein [Chloracidobacterium sp.]
MFRKLMYVVVVATAATAYSQENTRANAFDIGSTSIASQPAASLPEKRLVAPFANRYHNQTDGISLAEIVRLAVASNGNIKIAQLEIEKARARLTQAGLRSNPTLEVEQSTGRIVGSPGDRGLSVGFSLPVDVYGQRQKRIDLARAEITLREAELTTRQREVTGQVLNTYAEALAALKELQVLDDLLELDTQTVRFVQTRVNEGETAPLELSLLQTEVERLRARREIADGNIQTALTRLKFYAGVAYDQPLKLREEISAAQIPQLPTTSETGISLALRSRPELRVAELEEQLASAGLRLVRSQSKPDVTAYTRYTQGRSSIDLPVGSFPQSTDRSLTFGVSIGLPIFDKKQGAKAEAEIAIRQAQERRSFAEAIIRNEVVTAFQRIESAKRALRTLETAVIPRSLENIETIRKVYELGQLKITDLIAEQRKLLDANRDLTEALTLRYRSQAELFIAIGANLEN